MPVMDVVKLAPSDLGGRIAVSSPLGLYEGVLDDIGAGPSGYLRVSLVTDTRTQVSVVVPARSTAWFTPAPKLAVGDHVVKAGFTDPASTWFEVPIIGRVVRIGIDRKRRPIFGVQWSNETREVYHLRRGIQPLTAEIRQTLGARRAQMQEGTVR